MSNTAKYTNAVAAVLADLPATRRGRFGLKDERLPAGVPLLAVARPVVGPQCVTISFQVDDRDAHLVLGPRTAERMAIRAGAQHVRTYRDRQLVRAEFDLPREEWREVAFSGLMHSASAVTVGEKAVGGRAYVTWDSPNKALFGLPGSGKTVCLIDMAMSIVRTDPGAANNEFVWLNPKRERQFEPLRRLPHLAIAMADGYSASALALRWAVAEMERRKMDPGRAAKRLVVFADEVAQLVQVQPDAVDSIRKLGQFGRAMNVNLLIASQVANPTVFGEHGSKTKSLFGSRLVFQLPNDQAAMATGLRGQETAFLGGLGDALAVNGAMVTRFRAAIASRRDYEALPRVESPADGPNPADAAGDRALEPDDEVIFPDELEIEHVFDTGSRYRASFLLNELGERLAYALITKSMVNGRLQPVGADGIQKRFGGAMATARLLRDLAQAVRRDAAKFRQESTR